MSPINKVTVAIAAMVLPLAPATYAQASAPVAEQLVMPAASTPKPKACKAIGNKSMYTRPIGAGKGSQVTAYFDTLRCLLKGATKGSTVRFTVYSAYDNDFAQLFAATKERGVNVRFTTSQAAADDDPAFFKILEQALGTNVKKASYLNLCRKACNTKDGGPGFMHDKTGLFSSVLGPKGKTYKNLILRTSGNLSSGFTAMFNHSYELKGRNKLYAGLKNYFDGSRLNRTKHGFKPVTDGPFTAYMFPAKKPVMHPSYAALKGVNCKAKKGYGTSGHTTVRVMMSIWEDDHLEVVTLLSKLATKKCNVAVAIATNDGKSGDKVIAALKKAKFPVYDASKGGRSMHSKMVAISGTVNGKSQALVYDGSLNFSQTDAGKNDETVLLNRSKTEFKRADNAFKVVKKYSDPM